MKMSRKAKRYDESILPGEFEDFEDIQEGGPEQDACLRASLRRQGKTIELGQVSLEHNPIKKQSFAKLRNKAELLTKQLDYLRETLEIVDHDRRGMYIQLRSLPPYKDDTQIQFNEICIGRDKISLKRIAFYRKDEVKQQVALNLTEDEMMRLFNDLRGVFTNA